jgi:HAD superfamily hydrolase (TIGR01509 family)
MLAAVIFDMDGVLIDSEHVWDTAREQYVIERGGRWHERAQRAMMGMSSTEWSAYVRDELGVDETPAVINEQVVARIRALYEAELPMIPGSRAAVRRLRAAVPLGLASSSNRSLIDLVLDGMGLAEAFRATVSSEEVSRGKPEPDVYLEAARRLDVTITATVAVEDSHNGILAARASGAGVIAIPNTRFRPGEDALAAADVTVDSIDELTVELCRGIADSTRA